MIKRLIEKWFGLESEICPVCEVLREQLAISERERRELLHRALTPTPIVEDKRETEAELKPILPQFTPWRVRQQILEQEDRRQAELLKKKREEISELEKELEIGAQSNA